MTTEQIGAKLVLDDEASEALHKVKEGFEHVREKVHETGHEIVSMAKQAATFAIGFQLSGAVETMKEFGHEVVEGAMHLGAQKKELASYLALADKGGLSFDELKEKAGELNERFEKFALSAGAVKDDLIDAFGDIASRSTQLAEHSAEMVEKMTIASRIIPGGLSEMSNAWRDLEVGFVRPKNALVQLIRQTGVAAGSAKDVAKALNQMTQQGKQQEVFELAQRAIDRMATRMKDVPMTMGQALNALKGYREIFFETMGTPILRVIGPQFTKLQQYIVGHRDEIEHLAHTMGTQVGAWVQRAAAMIRKGSSTCATIPRRSSNRSRGAPKPSRGRSSSSVEHRQLLLGLFLAQTVGGSETRAGCSARPGGRRPWCPDSGAPPGPHSGRGRSG